MELADIIPVEEWTALEEELYALCGMNVRVYNQEGKHITPHEGWANTLCPLIRSKRDGLMTVCSVAQQNASAQARKSKAPVMSECDAGLVKFVVPIFQGDEFLGTIGGCGYRNPDVDVETDLLHDITGVDLEELTQEASGVGLMTEEKAAELMNHFQERLNAILARAKNSTD
jgi:ligand-binding sensor protein